MYTVGRNLPFLEPRVAQILYATASGILLSAGTGLVLGVIDRPASGWERRHTIGILCIVASMLISGLAWLAQGFLDFLVSRGKDRESGGEKALQFDSWSHRRLARGLAVIIVALFAVI
ncbi:MAG TPA: hypothetical protein ENO08_03775, partial [Candidatus Eisenbacteria bacterium]|nr:hypothetical protein [Candidatus Eisenbacteria bacterium]